MGVGGGCILPSHMRVRPALRGGEPIPAGLAVVQPKGIVHLYFLYKILIEFESTVFFVS